MIRSPEHLQHELGSGHDAPRTIFDRVFHQIIPRNGRVETAQRSMWQRFPELGKIPEDGWPKNVFIIPDGNGRWAQAKKLAVAAGHEKGSEVIVKAFNDFSELSSHIPFVGAWGLSMDNLKRSPREVDYLMGLFKTTIEKLRPDILRRGDRFIRIGSEDVFDGYPDVRKALDETEEETRENRGQVIYVAVGFSGEDQELRIAQKLAEKVRVNPGLEVTTELIHSLRDGEGLIPPADLVIRTSGEQRLSDLGWIAGRQTELFFSKKLFPSCSTGDFVKALVDFSKRNRRFGERSTTS